MRKVLLAASSVLATSVILAAAIVAAPAANAADCQHTFHARPTITAWVADPCAVTTGSGTGISIRVEVDYFWSQSGGAHITDVRGFFRVCNEDSSQVARVSADAVALHKYLPGGELYAQSNQPQQVSTDCATMLTVSRAVRGCGGTDNPLGPASYESYVEARGAYRDTSGNLHRLPADNYYGTQPSYYRTVIAGAAC